MKKTTRKLKLARESIRLLSRELMLDTPIAGGATAALTCVSNCESCGGSCEPSGIIACIPSRTPELCL